MGIGPRSFTVETVIQASLLFITHGHRFRLCDEADDSAAPPMDDTELCGQR